MRNLFLLALACASGCDQISTPSAAGTQAESTAATSVVKPLAPRVLWATPHEGIELKSGGTVSLVLDGGDGLDVLHVRVGLAPRGGAFTGDASTASFEMLGVHAVHPIAVNAQLATLPISRIEAGDGASVDLFFRLPADRVGDSGVFTWSVTTPGGATALRAVLPLDGEIADKRLAGPHWWFSSTFAWPRFRHHDGVITAKPPTSASVPQLAGPNDDEIPNPCDEW